MKQKSFIALAALVGIAFSTFSFANPDKIKTAFEKQFPGEPPKSIVPIANTGLWEVFNGTYIVYADSNASFFIAGPMIELATRRNLTQARLDKLIVTDFASLPVEQAFTLKRGGGTRRIALFADPQCSYCKRLESELANLDDVAVDVYLTPMLGAASVERAKDIVCSANKSEAWTSWMLKGEVPQKSSDTCGVSFEKNLALGKSLGIRAVPVLVFSDGTRLAGAHPRAEIEKRLAAISAASKATAP